MKSLRSVMKMGIWTVFLFALASFVWSGDAMAASQDLYVAPTAQGTGDGSSAANATTLLDAFNTHLGDIANGETDRIFFTAGTYSIDDIDSASANVTTDDILDIDLDDNAITYDLAFRAASGVAASNIILNGVNNTGIFDIDTTATTGDSTWNLTIRGLTLNISGNATAIDVLSDDGTANGITNITIRDCVINGDADGNDAVSTGSAISLVARDDGTNGATVNGFILDNTLNEFENGLSVNEDQNAAEVDLEESGDGNEGVVGNTFTGITDKPINNEVTGGGSAIFEDEVTSASFLASTNTFELAVYAIDPTATPDVLVSDDIETSITDLIAGIADFEAAPAGNDDIIEVSGTNPVIEEEVTLNNAHLVTLRAGQGSEVVTLRDDNPGGGSDIGISITGAQTYNIGVDANNQGFLLEKFETGILMNDTTDSANADIDYVTIQTGVQNGIRIADQDEGTDSTINNSAIIAGSTTVAYVDDDDTDGGGTDPAINMNDVFANNGNSFTGANLVAQAESDDTIQDGLFRTISDAISDREGGDSPEADATRILILAATDNFEENISITNGAAGNQILSIVSNTGIDPTIVPDNPANPGVSITAGNDVDLGLASRSFATLQDFETGILLNDTTDNARVDVQNATITGAVESGIVITDSDEGNDSTVNNTVIIAGATTQSFVDDDDGDGSAIAMGDVLDNNNNTFDGDLVVQMNGANVVDGLFSQIQPAIQDINDGNVASANIVEVRTGGTYQENLTASAAMTVRVANGTDVIVDAPAGDTGTGLLIDDVDVTVGGNNGNGFTFQDFANSGIGIQGANAESSQIWNSTFSNNEIHVAIADETAGASDAGSDNNNLRVHSNTFRSSGSTDDAIRIVSALASNVAVASASADTVYAARNYFDSADGPSGQGSGSGESVGVNVVYSPWLGVEPGSSDTQTYTVDTSPGFDAAVGNDPTLLGALNDAVDAAAANDSMLLTDGTYDLTGSIAVDQANLSIAADSLGDVTLAGGGFDSAAVSVDNVTINNIIFTGSTAGGFAGIDLAGGVDPSNLSISGNEFNDNTAHVLNNGGADFAEDLSGIVDNNTFDALAVGKTGGDVTVTGLYGSLQEAVEDAVGNLAAVEVAQNSTFNEEVVLTAGTTNNTLALQTDSGVTATLDGTDVDGTASGETELNGIELQDSANDTDEFDFTLSGFTVQNFANGVYVSGTNADADDGVDLSLSNNTFSNNTNNQLRNDTANVLTTAADIENYLSNNTFDKSVVLRTGANVNVSDATGIYSIIQGAIDASNTAGDVVDVASGTYTESVEVDKSVIVQGVSNATPAWDGDRPAKADETIVTPTGVGSGKAFVVTVDDATVTGVFIEDATTTGIEVSSDANNVDIENVIIDNSGLPATPNFDPIGAAFVGSSTGGSITGSRITGNAYGVFFENDSTDEMTVRESQITGNDDGDNYGMIVGVGYPTSIAAVSESSGIEDVDARFTWWGASDGPATDGNSSATGSGDRVSPNINFGGDVDDGDEFWAPAATNFYGNAVVVTVDPTSLSATELVSAQVTLRATNAAGISDDNVLDVTFGTSKATVEAISLASEQISVNGLDVVLATATYNPSATQAHGASPFDITFGATDTINGFAAQKSPAAVNVTVADDVQEATAIADTNTLNEGQSAQIVVTATDAHQIASIAADALAGLTLDASDAVGSVVQATYTYMPGYDVGTTVVGATFTTTNSSGSTVQVTQEFSVTDSQPEVSLVIGDSDVDENVASQVVVTATDADEISTVGLSTDNDVAIAMTGSSTEATSPGEVLTATFSVTPSYAVGTTAVNVTATATNSNNNSVSESDVLNVTDVAPELVIVSQSSTTITEGQPYELVVAGTDENDAFDLASSLVIEGTPSTATLTVAGTNPFQATVAYTPSIGEAPANFAISATVTNNNGGTDSVNTSINVVGTEAVSQSQAVVLTVDGVEQVGNASNLGIGTGGPDISGASFEVGANANFVVESVIGIGTDLTPTAATPELVLATISDLYPAAFAPVLGDLLTDSLVRTSETQITATWSNVFYDFSGLLAGVGGPVDGVTQGWELPASKALLDSASLEFLGVDSAPDTALDYAALLQAATPVSDDVVFEVTDTAVIVALDDVTLASDVLAEAMNGLVGKGGITTQISEGVSGSASVRVLIDEDSDTESAIADQSVPFTIDADSPAQVWSLASIEAALVPDATSVGGFPAASNTNPLRARSGDELTFLFEITNPTIDETGNDDFRQLPGTTFSPIAITDSILEVTGNFSMFNPAADDLSAPNAAEENGLEVVESGSVDEVHATFTMNVSGDIGTTVASSSEPRVPTATVRDDAGNFPLNSYFDMDNYQRSTTSVFAIAGATFAVDNFAPTIGSNFSVVLNDGEAFDPSGTLIEEGDFIPTGSTLLPGTELEVQVIVTEMVDVPLDIANNSNYGAPTLQLLDDTTDSNVGGELTYDGNPVSAFEISDTAVAIPFRLTMPATADAVSTSALRMIAQVTDTVGNTRTRTSANTYTLDSAPGLTATTTGLDDQGDDNNLTFTANAGITGTITANAFDQSSVEEMFWDVGPAEIDGVVIDPSAGNRVLNVSPASQSVSFNLSFTPAIGDATGSATAIVTATDDMDLSSSLGTYEISFNQPALFTESDIIATVTNTAGAGRSETVVVGESGLNAAGSDIRSVTLHEGETLDIEIIATDADLDTVDLEAGGTALSPDNAIASSISLVTEPAAATAQYTYTPGFETVSGDAASASFILDLTATDGIHPTMDHTSLQVVVVPEAATPEISVVTATNVAVGDLDDAGVAVPVAENATMRVVVSATDPGDEVLDLTLTTTPAGVPVSLVTSGTSVMFATATFIPGLQDADIDPEGVTIIDSAIDPFALNFAFANSGTVETLTREVNITNTPAPPIVDAQLSVDGSDPVPVADGDDITANRGSNLVFTFEAVDPDGGVLRIPAADIADVSNVIATSSLTSERPNDFTANGVLSLEISPAAPAGATATVTYVQTAGKTSNNETELAFIIGIATDVAPVPEDEQTDEVVYAHGFGGFTGLETRNLDQTQGALMEVLDSFPALPTEFEEIVGGNRDRATYVSIGDVNMDGQQDIVATFGPVTESATFANMFITWDGRNKDSNGNALLAASPVEAFPTRDDDEFISYLNGELRSAVGDFIGSGSNQVALAMGVGSASGTIRLVEYDTTADDGEIRLNSDWKVVGQFQGLTDDPRNGAPIDAFSRNLNGGVTVAAGDLDGDGIDELIAGQTNSASSQAIFQVHDIAASGDVAVVTEAQVSSFQFRAFGDLNDGNGGIELAVADLNNDGSPEVIAASMGNEAPGEGATINLIGVYSPVITDGQVTGFTQVPGFLFNILTPEQNPSGALSISAGEFNGDPTDGRELVAGTGAIYTYDAATNAVGVTQPAPEDLIYFAKANYSEDGASITSISNVLQVLVGDPFTNLGFDAFRDFIVDGEAVNNEPEASGAVFVAGGNTYAVE